MNAYLLPGDPVTLVDPGPRWRQSLTGLEAALAEERLHVDDVELLVLTHQHQDHVGLAATIQRRSGCVVAGHELLADLLADEAATRAGEDAYEIALMRLHGIPDTIVAEVPRISAQARGYGESVEVGLRLADGDVLAAGDRELEVALRPGHSPTDTIFLLGDGSALLGDHLLLDSPAVTVAHRPPRGSADPRERPRALLDYRASLAATANRAVTSGFPGHGDRVGDAAAAIADRLAAQDRRAERLLGKLGREPQTAWEIAESVWQADRGPAEAHPLPVQYIVLSDVLSHLDLLVETGRAREQDDGDRIVFEATVG